MSPFERRFLYVTGKGGVGKTTVAASLARAGSLAGRRVLLAVTDTESYRDLLPGARFREDPTEHRPGLFTVSIQSDAALKEYGRLLIKPRLARAALFDNRYVQGFLTALPGLPQWAVLGKAWYHTTELVDGAPRFDSVIFDAPATGHAIDMLRLPRVITELAPASILRRDAELAWNMLQDPAASSIVLVSLPEELPTNETLELAARITDELKLPLGAVVQNRVRELTFDDVQRAALSAQPAIMPGITPTSDVDATVEAAAARAIRERAQIESRERLAPLRASVVELPEVNPTLPIAQMVEELARVFDFRGLARASAASRE